MGRKSRVKGRAWEQEVARMLRPLFGEEVKRGWQARLGADAPDVDGTPFWWECKHGGSVAAANPYKAIAQALAATDGRPVVAVCKVGSATSKIRHEPIAAMPLPQFLSILERLRLAESLAKLNPVGPVRP